MTDIHIPPEAVEAAAKVAPAWRRRAGASGAWTGYSRRGREPGADEGGAVGSSRPPWVFSCKGGAPTFCLRKVHGVGGSGAPWRIGIATDQVTTCTFFP